MPDLPSSPSPQSCTSHRPLSSEDLAILVELEKKFQVVRDRVAGVARGYYAGLVLAGRGGTGRSWTVQETLDQLRAPHAVHNSHLTPRALFDELEARPEDVHVIEDAEGLLHNRVALGVLRSATWGNRRNRAGRIERLITWNTHRANSEVVFEGGIVLVTNRLFFRSLRIAGIQNPHPLYRIHRRQP